MHLIMSQERLKSIMITANNMLYKNSLNSCSQLVTPNSPKPQVWKFYAYFWNKVETYTILFFFFFDKLPYAFQIFSFYILQVIFQIGVSVHPNPQLASSSTILLLIGTSPHQFFIPFINNCYGIQVMFNPSWVFSGLMSG